MIGQIWKLALNDLRLTLRDRPSFIWMLIMPLAMMWFFGNMGGGGTGPPSIALSVVDGDGRWLARAVVDELAGEQVDLRELTPEEAGAAEGKVRTLVIPAGFTAGALAGEQQTLRLEKEPDSDEQFGFAAQVHILRAIVRSTARLIEMQELESASDDELLAAFRELGARDKLVRLDVSTAGRGRPVPRGRAQSVPGIMTFVVLMMTLIYGGVFLTIEKRQGMIRRLASAPLTRRRILLGKLLGRLLLAAMQLVPLVLAGRYLFGLSWGRSPAGLVLLLGSYAVAVAGLATLMGAVLRTPEQAGSVGWIGGMVMAAIGGCWWPAELMPAWMRSVARLFPTAWAMDGFHALISFGHGLEAVLLPSAALLAFGALFAMLGARFLSFDS